MELSVKTIADHLGGVIEGSADIRITGFARIEQAKEGDLCFLANPKYEEWLYKTKASLAIVSRSFALKQPVNLTVIWVDNAYQGIAAMLNLYAALNARERKGREFPSRVSWRSRRGKNCYIGAFAYIGRGAKIGNNVKIFPHAYIGDNVSIGDNTLIYAGVTVYAGCSIGANCVIHSGAVIGSDGFGFVPDKNMVYKKIEQVGNVVVCDNVEIGANTCIDRATMNSTIVHDGVKLDNLVHLAHNVEVGANTVMAGGTCIAGSVKIGERCMFGGQSGVVPHTVIGCDTQIAAQSGVINNVGEKGRMLGYPAIPHNIFLRSYAIFKNLDELQKKVLDLVKKVEKQQQ